MSCSICDEISGRSDSFENKKYRSLIEKRFNIIAETSLFAIVPSLGPLNECHVLIVPKNHILSIAQLDHQSSNEIYEIKSKLTAHARSEGKSLIFFEHGTGSLIDKSGGCIEHAHLHCVNEYPDVVSVFKSEIGLHKIPDEIQLSQIANTDLGYAYLEDSRGYRFIKNSPSMPPQYFRKAYANLDKSVEVWNWRFHINYKLIEKVLKFYSSFRL